MTSCRNLCDKLAYPCFPSPSPYLLGLKYCTKCAKYFKSDAIRCPCCNRQLRFRRREFSVKWARQFQTSICKIMQKSWHYLRMLQYSVTRVIRKLSFFKLRATFVSIVGKGGLNLTSLNGFDSSEVGCHSLGISEYRSGI